MYAGKKVAVIVPAYNEEKLIRRVLESMPNFVDKVIVVDDASKDRTVEMVRKFADDTRIDLVTHARNQGVGAAITSGYKRSLDLNIDIAAVMAGDAQMDPEDLEKIIQPVAQSDIDYCKGNRLFTGKAWRIIPKHRYLGNAFLSLVTKIASGYWYSADSQSGYTAISNAALRRIDLDLLYKRYGFPNDLLVKLNVANCKVLDVPIKPVYNVGESSKMKLWKVIPTLSLLLIRNFFWRIFQKYVIRDFHPLVFFYLMGMALMPLGLILGFLILYRNTSLGVGPALPVGWIVLCALTLISGMQSLFFAMWFDMDYNRQLNGRR